jgi:hypothetical protein
MVNPIYHEKNGFAKRKCHPKIVIPYTTRNDLGVYALVFLGRMDSMNELV